MKHEGAIATPAARGVLQARAALAVFVGVLLLNAVLYLRAAADAVRFPHELDYGEGIVWEQLRLMAEGRGYGAIDAWPAIVFHYPPLYHLVSGAVAATGLDGLAAGRLVSIAALLSICGLAGLLVRRVVRPFVPGGTATLCGLLAAFLPFSLWPLTNWSLLMRVDLLATALSLAGLLAGLAALARPGRIALAALLFVAAVYTKQTSLAAPAALFVTLMLVRPRLAWILAGACTALGLLVLASLAAATDGGFLRHILLYNVNRLDLARGGWIAGVAGAHALYILAAVFGVRALLGDRAGRLRAEGAGLLLLLLYAAFAGLLTLTVLKSGSSYNYFIDGLVALGLLVGVALAHPVRAALGQPSHALAGLIAILAAAQAAILPWRTMHATAVDVEMTRLVELARVADKPIVSDDMVLLRRAGRPVWWEPAIFAELASTGVWDERPFIDRIRRGEFAFFVTAGSRGEPLFDSRYNPAVAAAMAEAYPVRAELAGRTLHLPQAPRRPASAPTM